MSDENVLAQKGSADETPDLICVSCSRWSALDQDRRRLLSREAREGRRVFFVEAPSFDAGAFACVDLVESEGVRIAVPHLPGFLADSAHADEVLEGLMEEMLAATGKRQYELWYDAASPAPWVNNLNPLAVAAMTGENPAAGKSVKAAAGVSRG